MLIIRFSRTGRKNKAQFRIVLQEHTIAPTGKHIEILGSYSPHSKEGVFKKERIQHWMEQGVQISDSVFNLFVKNEIIKEAKRPVKITNKKKEGEEESVGDKPAVAEAKADKPAVVETKEEKKEDAGKSEEKKEKEESKKE